MTLLIGPLVAAVVLSAASGGTAMTSDRLAEFLPKPGQPSDFAGPIGVRCDRHRIFVVDDLAHRISIHERDGTLLQVLGRQGNGPGELSWPDAMHWGADGSLYVADTGANRIQVWTADGRYLREFGREASTRVAFLKRTTFLVALAAAAVTVVLAVLWQFQMASTRAVFAGVSVGLCAAIGWVALRVLAPQILHNPRDVLVGPDGTSYVADFGSDAVRVFEAGGQLVRTIGAGGEGQLRKPLGLALGDDNLLYVSDSGNHRIVVFTTIGKFVRAFGGPGRAPGQFQSPHGVVLTPGKLLVVADRDNGRLQLLRDDGSVVETADGTTSGAVGSFTPAGVCLTPDGAILAADIARHRLLEWRPVNWPARRPDL
jgi:DNA-binding beta-propeller fold protein YncE